MHRLLSMAAGLSDAELLRRVVLLAGREREATVELVGHLAELDSRKLHVAEGYGSLFAYCTRALRLAEHAAYNRIEAARLSRRFPAILDLLADGSLNLSTARLLAPHLRPDNFETLVAQARARSKRDVEALVARLAPRPDVAASVRRLPARAQATPVQAPPALLHDHGRRSRLESEAGAQPALPRCSRLPRTLPTRDRGGGTDGRRTGPDHLAGAGALSRAVHHRRRDPREAAPSPGAPAPRDPEWRSRRDLRPGTDAPARRSRPQEAGRGRGSSPRTSSRPSTRTRSRHIPAPVKRAVWLRDGGRCAFVAPMAGAARSASSSTSITSIRMPSAGRHDRECLPALSVSQRLRGGAGLRPRECSCRRRPGVGCSRLRARAREDREGGSSRGARSGKSGSIE